jgi:hypothetical protein
MVVRMKSNAQNMFEMVVLHLVLLSLALNKVLCLGLYSFEEDP